MCLVGRTKSKAPSAHLLPVCNRDCLCQHHVGRFLCLFQGGRSDQRGVPAPAPFLPVGLSLGSQDGYWRAFQRSLSPGTGAIAVKSIVTHLQRSDHHHDSILQSICTFTRNPDGKAACSACSLLLCLLPLSYLSSSFQSLRIYSSVTQIKIRL